MVELYTAVGFRLKAQFLLKQNIEGLLRAQNKEQKALAQWCWGRSESWISKWLRNDRRGVPLKYLDRIADFFGLATYQLFQPGIVRASERRLLQRRSGQDRRLSRRDIVEATSEAQRRDDHGTAESSRIDAELKKVAADFERRVTALVSQAEPRRQTPKARGTVPPTRKSRRISGGSDPPPD